MRLKDSRCGCSQSWLAWRGKEEEDRLQSVFNEAAEDFNLHLSKDRQVFT